MCIYIYIYIHIYMDIYSIQQEINFICKSFQQCLYQLHICIEKNIRDDGSSD